MQTKNTATRYSQEFRESMVSLIQTGRSAILLSKEYNVSISKWINKVDSMKLTVLSLRE